MAVTKKIGGRRRSGTMNNRTVPDGVKVDMGSNRVIADKAATEQSWIR